LLPASAGAEPPRFVDVAFPLRDANGASFGVLGPKEDAGRQLQTRSPGATLRPPGEAQAA
jgi:hypothetical protein